MQPRIVFMGTPEFAVASLDKLCREGFNIVAVITAPDKPAGRGLKITESAVKKYALINGLKVLQPLNLKDPGFIHELELLKADLQIVVAFRMLPEVVWTMSPMGTVNLHGSLLPHYRGAAPINWAIINGEEFTGVTTFKLKHQIDTGNILLRQSIKIGESENAGELHDRMKIIGAELLAKTIHGLINKSLTEIPQDEITKFEVKHAPKIFTETCQINWLQHIDQIFNLIRGLAPFPAAYTFLDNKKLKIFSAQKEYEDHNGKAGKLITDGKTFIRFTAVDGYIDLKEIQLEGKKRMTVPDFLRGYKINTK